MHEEIVRRAAMPVSQVVLGLLLRPYSLGHELLIQTGPRFETVEGALAASVLICANTWEENNRIQTDFFTRFKLWLWRIRCRKANFFREAAEFAKYREEGSLEFPLSDVADPDAPHGRTLGASFLFCLHQFLI